MSLERDGDIVTLTIHRPEVMNCLSFPTLKRLRKLCHELKNDLSMDRTSSTSFLANQLRVLMAAAAFALYQEMRWELRGTELARAQTSTLRLRIVKIAGQLIRSTRRLLVRLPESCPDARIWCKLAYRIGASPG